MTLGNASCLQTFVLLLGELHQLVHFITRPFEILKTESVDSDIRYAQLETPSHDVSKLWTGRKSESRERGSDVTFWQPCSWPW